MGELEGHEFLQTMLGNKPNPQDTSRGTCFVVLFGRFNSIHFAHYRSPPEDKESCKVRSVKVTPLEFTSLEHTIKKGYRKGEGTI